MAPRTLKYVDTPELPAKRPFGYPHLIDTSFNDETSTAGLSAADGIATWLWNHNKEHFKAFFDLSIYTAEFHYTSTWGIKDMIIARNDRHILAGFRLDDGKWDPQVSYGIEADGKWRPLTTMVGSDQDSVMYGPGFAQQILIHKMWEVDGDKKKIKTLINKKKPEMDLYPIQILGSECFKHNNPICW